MKPTKRYGSNLAPCCPEWFPTREAELDHLVSSGQMQDPVERAKRQKEQVCRFLAMRPVRPPGAPRPDALDYPWSILT